MKKFIALIFVCLLFVGCAKKEATEEVETPETPEGEVLEEETLLTNLSKVEDFDIEVSSVLEDETDVGFKYDADMMLDKDFSTAWCLTSDDDEKKISIDFEEKVQGGLVGIVPGFGREEGIYFQNNRVKKLKVVMDDEEKDFEFPDEYKMHFIDLSDYQFENLDFVIEEVYEGSKFDDICISELDFSSEYVLEENADAAMKFYEENKAGGALRPDDIVDEVNVTDFAFVKGEAGPFALGEYEGMQKCAGSVYAPGRTDNFVDLSRDAYAFAEINSYGRLGDEVDVEWFYEEKHRPLDEFGGEDFSADYIHDAWTLIFSENNLEVFKTCAGNLYAYSEISSDLIGKYYYDERPLGRGGTYKVVFYRNGKVVGSQEFGGLYP